MLLFCPLTASVPFGRTEKTTLSRHRTHHPSGQQLVSTPLTSISNFFFHTALPISYILYPVIIDEWHLMNQLLHHDQYSLLMWIYASCQIVNNAHAYLRIYLFRLYEHFHLLSISYGFMNLIPSSLGLCIAFQVRYIISGGHFVSYTETSYTCLFLKYLKFE